MRDFSLYFILIQLLSLFWTWRVLFFIIKSIITKSFRNLFVYCQGIKCVVNHRNRWLIFVFPETVVLPIILTFFTFTSLSTSLISVKALTIFFETEWFFAVTRPLLRFKRLFIGIWWFLNFLVILTIRLFISIGIFSVFTTNTFASVSALITYKNK